MTGKEDPVGWRFGAWQMDAVTRCVTRGAELVPLADTETRLLLTLLRAEGEAVSKDDLLGTVWSNAAVNENALSNSVSRLRAEFGPEIAETVFRHGYRLGLFAERLGSFAEYRALALTALFIEAERERQIQRDVDWDKAHLGRLPEVRDALDWALARPERRHLAIGLAGATARLWERASMLPEGRGYLGRALRLLYVDEAERTVDRSVRKSDAARLLAGGGILWRESDRKRSVSLLQRAAAIFREIEDTSQLGPTLQLVGGGLVYLGKHDEARATLEEAKKILSLLSQTKALWNALNDLGLLSAIQDMPIDAIHQFTQARDLAQEMGDTLREYIVVLNMGEAEFAQGAVTRAIQRAQEAVRGLKSAPMTFRIRPIVNLATYEAWRGNLRRSRTHAKAVLPLAASEGGYWLRLCLQVWAFLAASDGGFVDAARLIGFVDAQYARYGEARQTPERLLAERLQELLRANLSLEDNEVWRQEGSGWTEEDAVNYVTVNLVSPQP
jgi:tetratricopeptide (TPR) repeat protein